MTLPDLALQIVYARLAWGLALAALLLAGLQRLSVGARWKHLRLLSTAVSFGVMWLPGPLSPAYWLGLVFNFPSAALVAVCAVALTRRWSGSRPVPVDWGVGAFALAAGGAFLYLDSTGWTSLQLYAFGADPRLAPIAALTLGAVALGALRDESTRPSGIVLLASVVAFSVFRLPSGNLFDSVLDPLLWLVSLAPTVDAAWRQLRRSVAWRALPRGERPGDDRATAWLHRGGSERPGAAPDEPVWPRRDGNSE